MNEPILLVDDNPRLLAGARLALEMNGFSVITANSGNEAILTIQRTRPALIVSDILMPGCDGFTLLEKVHAHSEWVTIPFLFLSALDDPASLDRGRVMGADDYLTKPFTPRALVRAVRGRLDRAKSIQNAHFSEAYLETIFVIARAIEARDVYTGRHIEQVAHYAVRLARDLGWPAAEVEEVYRAAILHDVGKVAIPDVILNKPGALTPEEWEVMKTHPEKGAEIMSPLSGNSPMILDGVLYHHERYDGQGYPRGLAGEAIPRIGRLLAIADAYDAMTSSRAYRDGLSKDEAISRLIKGAGSQFDPKFVEIFIRQFPICEPLQNL